MVAKMKETSSLSGPNVMADWHGLLPTCVIRMSATLLIM